MLTETINYYMGYGQGAVLILFFGLIFPYLAWRILILLFGEKADRQRAVVLILAIGKISVLILMLGGIIGMGVLIITYKTADRVDINANNAALMDVDLAVFGTSIPFWMQSETNNYKYFFDFIGPLLVNVYLCLTLLFCFGLLFLFFIKGRNCAQLLLGFFTCIVVSTPLWYVLPAFSPLEGYIYPIIPATPSSNFEKYITSYSPNNSLRIFFDHVRSLRNADERTFYPITTFPSMHVAWATILVYFVAQAWYPSLTIGMPYFFLNLVATVYTMEHYAIDLIAGLSIGILAIIIVRALPIDRSASVQNIINLAENDFDFIVKYWLKKKTYIKHPT